MKQLLIAMAMMSAMAMAQTSAGSTDQNNPSSSTPQASSTQSSTSTDPSAQTPDKSKDTSAMPQSDKAGGKEKTVKGCLHKDGDNYWLATKMSKYHVMSSQDLSAHDGHEVKVTGTTSEGPMPASTDNKKVKHLEATNVEMVSEKCSMGEKSMKMKGDELEKKDTSSTPK